ncbi:hypothetical protein GTP23_21195 [Pseudoduganella sp. FT93W]|uniref:PIN domain-containing protein n=1 Tax=Duganella fentianensis TaxID=2692177 RepID=A0A845I559_9BURK|nr:hypothetical protein [Duganella fentianensis]MYN47567.1 hypothetical protein [Duganella fentianensis]
MDLVREKIREGKTTDALEILNSLGDPSTLKDQFSRFRWYTNKAAIDLANGEHALAAQGCLQAFKLAPGQEVAHFNKVRAHILLDDIQSANAACKEALERFPESATLWSLYIYILDKEGVTSPFDGIPASIAESRDILLMKAELHHKHSEHAEAIELLKKAVELEPDQNDGKRAYLAVALSWAAQDTVQAHFRHMSEEHRELLLNAVSLFEPLEINLPAIQSDHISLEITNNVCAALLLLGEKERARTIVGLSLQRHPLADGLLRIRIGQLAEQNDLSAIRKLTDAHLSELPPILLAQLAEISGNAGELEWHDLVMQEVEAKMHLDKRLEELRAFRALAMSLAGDVEQGLQFARVYVETHPTQMMGQVILAQILQHSGDIETASGEAKKCVGLINDESSRADVIQVAELLYQLKAFVDAVPLYERLVSNPGADTLTWRLLICLLQGDMRAKVRKVLERLSSHVRAQPEFRRIECNLARRTSDWMRMKDLLLLDIAENPDSCDVALGYIGALYQLGESETLKDFLSKDTVFKDSSPENEYEYAKHQIFGGFEQLGMRRIYRLYRNNPSSTKLASYFAALSLMCKNWGALLNAGGANQGSAFELRSGSEVWWVAVEQEGLSAQGGWPEFVETRSPIATALSECQVGDSISISRGFANQTCEIISKTSLIGFAHRKAHEQLKASPLPQGPVWTVSLDSLVNSIKMSNADALKNIQESQMESSIRAYKEARLPLCTLAKGVSVDLISLLVDWKNYNESLMVSSGTPLEINEELNVLKVRSNRYVFDLFTISELVRHDAFDAAVKALGKPLVPASLRAYILQLLHAENSPHTAYRALSRREQIPGIVDPYLGHRKSFLAKLLRVVDMNCELTPVYGPEQLTADQLELSEVLDESNTDIFYLCLERGSVLVSEDFNMRLLAKQVGVKYVLGIQPILMGLRDAGAISDRKYTDAIGRKINDGHYFVNVSARDLLSWANIDRKKVSCLVSTGLKAFQNQHVDFNSVLRVFCEFLVAVSKDSPVVVVARYVELAHASLSSNLQPTGKKVLRQKLGELLQIIYGKGGRKLPVNQRRLFGEFFNKNA